MDTYQKGGGGGFGNLDGVVLERFKMSLRCAPVISIRWWLGRSLFENKITVML